MLGAFSFAIIYYIICKKLKIAHSELSPEFRKYRKKHIKTTAVIVAVSVAASLCFPFLNAISAVTSETSFSFLDGVGYQYDSDDDAIRDYIKLKDCFVSGKPLYIVFDESLTEKGYRLMLDEIDIEITQNEKGYQVINSVENTVTFDDEYEELYFDTDEKMQKYIDEKAFDSYEVLEYLKKDIRFDDVTYTVYSASNINYFTAVGDVMPAFILVAVGIATAETVISMIIYFIKKQKSKAGH